MWRASQEKQSVTERCVVCGGITEYGKETPVSERIGYVNGAGQLCQGCCQDLYLKGSECHD